MQLIGNLLVRLVAVFIGYILAVLAASIFLAFGLFNETFAIYFEDFHGHHYVESGMAMIFGAFVAATVSWTSLLPASIAIAIAELMRWNSMVANFILGGLCALFTGLSGYQLESGARPSESTIIILLACGFIAGFVYWLIAGRNAGSWLPDKPAKPT